MKKILSGILSAIFFSMTVLSCGLDTFYVVPAPIDLGILTIENNVPQNNAIQFRTNEQVASDFSFDGTYIYYKIFSSKDSCQTSYNSIDSVNNDSNYESASNKITGSYKKLKCVNPSGFLEDLLIESAGANRKIEIRLSDYCTPDVPSDIYTAYVKIDGVQKYVPVRSESTSDKLKYFNFGWHVYSSYNEICEVPSDSEDSDKRSSSDGYYYIDLYALAAGHDTTMKTFYSKPLHLGIIKINANSTMNY